MMRVFFMTSVLFTVGLSQEQVGNMEDGNNCLVSAGYSWCDSSQKCIRQWETPCDDLFLNCEDCLTKQRLGQNIACPSRCDLIEIDPMPLDPMPPAIPMPPVESCPEVMCMMYCPTGHQIDGRGCQMCQCNDNSPQQNNCPLVQPSCDGFTNVCPRLTEITTCNEGGPQGFTTYQLSLTVFGNNVQNIFAVYGDTQLNSAMSLPPAYQSSINQGQNIGGVSDYMKEMFPLSRYDSWLTIGITDGDPNNLISAIGVDFKDWTENTGIEITNGAVFLVDPEVDLLTQGNEIIIGQLTVLTHTSPVVTINIQGKTINFDRTRPGKQSWTEKNIQFPLIAPVYVEPQTVPMNCITWFDGCNTCFSNNGVLSGCSRLMCFREQTPMCRLYSTGH